VSGTQETRRPRHRGSRGRGDHRNKRMHEERVRKALERQELERQGNTPGADSLAPSQEGERRPD
jgi:hypothetical protein